MRLCMAVPARLAEPKNRKLRKMAMHSTLPVKMLYTHSYLQTISRVT